MEDKISMEVYAAKARQFIWKDVKHSIGIGVGAFVVIVVPGLFPANRDLLQMLVIVASFLLLIMLLKALVDWKRSYYLVETTDYSLQAQPYTRISGQYNYYFQLHSATIGYAVTQPAHFKKSIKNFSDTTFKIVTPFYEGLQGRNKKLLLLFSSTKTLLGCFDDAGHFISNT